MRKFIGEIDPVRVAERVSTRLEVTRYLEEGKPILFEDVEGYPNFRIVGNLYATRGLMAKALKTTEDRLIHMISEALDRPKGYRLVGSAEFLGNEVKKPRVLEHLPLITYYKRGGRRYTSATIVLARDPETGRENASFHRMMYLEENRFAIRLVPRDLHNFHQENRERGIDTQVAVVCGVHPAVALAAATSYPNLNELELANAFLDGGLNCVDLEGIDVPTDSEVVMVGRILKDAVAEEGPFVDLTGTWDAVREQPVVEVDRMYTRDQPIWQVILPGGSEHRLLMGLPQEPRMLRIIQNAVPSVGKVVLTEGGCKWLHAVVSIRKRAEGDGKNAGIAALSAHPSLKRVIVVDDDVDPMDSEMVEWALATRLQPSRGIVLIPGARGSSLDPSTHKAEVTTKWIVDATIPLDRDRRDFSKAGLLDDF
jgi:2,5-furandicarboxylate decarboxylase 1